MIIKNLKEKIVKKLSWVNIEQKIYKLYLKSHKAYERKKYLIANYYSNLIYKRYNCCISPGAQIGKNLSLPHPVGVVIGEGVKIGDNVVVYQNVTLGRKNRNVEEYPTIEDNVIIYCNSTVAGKITIGHDSVIGCNSVVLKSVESNSKCVGVVK